MEASLERWRCALKRRGMKVSKSEIEYTSVNERETGEKVTKQVPKGVNRSKQQTRHKRGEKR